MYVFERVAPRSPRSPRAPPTVTVDRSLLCRGCPCSHWQLAVSHCIVAGSGTSRLSTQAASLSVCPGLGVYFVRTSIP
eukprot:3834772-Rhodomonas_salina.2